MAISWNLRRVLDKKVWEMMTPAPVATNAAGFVVIEHSELKNNVYYMTGVSSFYKYDHNNDAWIQLPNSGLTGTFGAGSCGAYHNSGPTGTATAGTTTTITTNLTLNQNLKGEIIRITAGPNAGLERTILNNTLGTNSVITVDVAFPTAITAASVYLLLTGRVWVINAGTTDFGYYDVALNTWNTTPSITNLPGTWSTDGKLLATTTSNFGISGTATSATATTLVNSAKNWASNQWTNFQVRLISGTGAGQVRTISSNTSTALTVAAWTIIPDATTTYSIEPNEDYLYLIGNNAVTMYRYSISGNAWTVLAPAVARAAAPGIGLSFDIMNYVDDPLWANENVILKGRRIYSFRGTGTSALDYYDIPSNSWVNISTSYVPAVETFTTGSSANCYEEYIYINKESTGRFFRFNVVTNVLEPWSTLLYPEGTAVLGSKLWVKEIKDGDSSVSWVYKLRNTGTELFRCMIIDNDTNTTTGGWLIEEI